MTDARPRKILYRTWRHMIARCYGSDDDNYAAYGARGIGVCSRWRESFNAFAEDMGQRPPGMSIDRIDNDGNYEPGNCRWATNATQSRNTRRNVVVDAFGFRRCLTDWAAMVGLPVNTLHKRIHSGWPHEIALTTPANSGNRVKPHTIYECVEPRATAPTSRHARGERNPTAKLTEDAAREIRELLRSGEMSLLAIGKLYGVSRHAVRHIRTGKTWGHVR